MSSIASQQNLIKSSSYSVFGIIVMIDDLANELELLDNLLDGCNNSESFHIPGNDMRAYLRFVARQQVTMDPEAEEMLNDYFSATRAIRPGSIINFQILNVLIMRRLVIH